MYIWLDAKGKDFRGKSAEKEKPVSFRIQAFLSKQSLLPAHMHAVKKHIKVRGRHFAANITKENVSNSLHAGSIMNCILCTGFMITALYIYAEERLVT